MSQRPLDFVMHVPRPVMSPGAGAERDGQWAGSAECMEDHSLPASPLSPTEPAPRAPEQGVHTRTVGLLALTAKP